MSVNKILNPGFGVGQAFGTPTTISITGTSTLSSGQWFVASNVAGTVGVQIQMSSTSNGVTGTWTIGQMNDGGFVVSDGTSVQMIGTATFAIIPVN